MTVGIYMITNLVNDKKYVGQAQDIKKRWSEHLGCLNSGKHCNAHLQFAWNKYGSEAFNFSIIEECSVELLDEYEQFWMDLFDVVVDGYNICPVAGSCRGYHHSDEAKAKISAARKGKGLSNETKAKLSACPRPIGCGRPSRPVVVTHSDGTEETFESISAAARSLGALVTSVQNVTRGRSKTVMGCEVRYAD